ncbi:hypothetical protein [Mycolicibacterium lutetiense]
MHLAIRSTLTAGVALAGAGAIAVSPISPVPLRDAAVSLPHSLSAPVELTALAGTFEDPIAVWSEVLGTAIESATQIGNDMSANPLPVLNQIITNQAGYAGLLATSLQAAADSYTQFFTSDDDYRFKYFARQASDYLAAGNVTDAAAVLKEVVFRLFAFANPLINIMQIPIAMSRNAVNAFAAVPDLLMPVGLAVLNPVEGAILASGDSAQDVLDAVTAGDPAAAFSALVNAPAVLTGAILNGYLHETGGGTSGLLSWSNAVFNRGLIQGLTVTLPQTIAKAIGWQGPSAVQAPVAPATDAPTGVLSLPQADHTDTASRIKVGTPTAVNTVKTVTLSVTPQRGVSSVPTAETLTENEAAEADSSQTSRVVNSPNSAGAESDSPDTSDATADKQTVAMGRKASQDPKRSIHGVRHQAKQIAKDVRGVAKTRNGSGKHRAGADQ